MSERIKGLGGSDGAVSSVLLRLSGTRYGERVDQGRRGSVLKVRTLLYRLLTDLTDLSSPRRCVSRGRQPLSLLFFPPFHFLPPSSHSLLSFHARLLSVDDRLEPAAMTASSRSVAGFPSLSSLDFSSRSLDPDSMHVSPDSQLEGPRLRLATASGGQREGWKTEQSDGVGLEKGTSSLVKVRLPFLPLHPSLDPYLTTLCSSPASCQLPLPFPTPPKQDNRNEDD
jgi:hypothetical protein